MKTQYKRDLTEESFYPLRSFRYKLPFHWQTAKPDQTDLAELLASKYSLPAGNLLRLIMYVDRAWYIANESEFELYYSDRQSLIEFDKKMESIERITIHGRSGSAEINNPHLIDKVYYYMIDKLDSSKENKKKKRPSERIIHLIASDVYNQVTIDLTNFNNVRNSRFKALCITGYIFGLYNIGIKKDEYIMNQKQYNAYRAEMKAKDIDTPPYLQYLYFKIRRIC